MPTLDSNNSNSSCIRCPFHGWEFSTSDGKCTRVPYSKDQKAPPGVKLKTWPVFESSGFVFIWFHAEGLAPTWTPPLINEIITGQWTYGGRTQDTVNCHMQEIPENGADVGHLEALHAPSIVCGGHFVGFWRRSLSLFLLGKHVWDAKWIGPGKLDTNLNPIAGHDNSRHDDENSDGDNLNNGSDKKDGHINNINLTHKLCLFGVTIYNLVLEIQQIGPSFVVLRFQSDSWGGSRGCYVQAVTPMASNKQRIIHHIYQVQGSVFGLLLSRFMLWSQSNMVSNNN